MNEFVQKISSYHILNYLVPGVLFVVLTESFTNYSLLQGNILADVFIYYIVGLIVSRFGSLVIEPVLKHTGFLNFASREDYLAASAKDPKIDILSEANNMYRSLLATILLIVIVQTYESAGQIFPVLNDWDIRFFVLISFALLLFSYRKQVAYITSRVKYLTNSKK
jgi:hypothetical protein